MKNRNTMQRRLVLETVQQLQTHPNAESIYQAVAAKHPQISKAPVYRNLNCWRSKVQSCIFRCPVMQTATTSTSNRTTIFNAECVTVCLTLRFPIRNSFAVSCRPIKAGSWWNSIKLFSAGFVPTATKKHPIWTANNQRNRTRLHGVLPTTQIYYGGIVSWN